MERRQAFLRKELQRLLRQYADEQSAAPEEEHELETICAVEKHSDYLSKNCYHINFLATTTTMDTKSRVLFFAQLWEDKREPDDDEWRAVFGDDDGRFGFGCRYIDRECRSPSAARCRITARATLSPGDAPFARRRMG